MKIKDQRLHQLAKYVYSKLDLYKSEKIKKAINTIIVVDYWDNVLEFLIKEGNLLVWYRNPKNCVECLYNSTENKFISKENYSKWVDTEMLEKYKFF